MATQNFQTTMPPIKLEQAICNIIESIAMEDVALSNLINTESEMFNKASKLQCNMNEYIDMNESVNKLMKSVARLQMLLQFELEDAQELLQKIDCSDEDDDDDIYDTNDTEEIEE
jgi:hypothetical protein